MQIPIFPLRTTLFPGGRLLLKIFEARYMDMTTECIQSGTPFGVCLIDSGDEVARAGQAAARPHAVGTLARITDWDMQQLGLLQIRTLGGQRFRIISTTHNAAALLNAEVELLADEASVVVPTEYRPLVMLLRAILEQADKTAPNAFVTPYRYDDASWVSMRLVEIISVQPLAKQKLLEISDATTRLEILFRYLSAQGLLPKGQRTQ